MAEDNTVVEVSNINKKAGKKYILKEGDAIYFDSSIPHTGRSIGKKKAKILTVLFPKKK